MKKLSHIVGRTSLQDIVERLASTVHDGETTPKAKPEDEKKFVKFHKTEKFHDMEGNKCDVYNASNVKTHDRAKTRQGHGPDEDDHDVSFSPKNEEQMEEEIINRSGTSTNAAGDKIPWKHQHNTNTGKSSVEDKFGKRDATIKKIKKGPNTPNFKAMVSNAVKRHKGVIKKSGLGEEANIEEERKVSGKIVDAFLAGKSAKSRNDKTDGKSMHLHGNKIAWHGEGGAIHATAAGWGTPTTKERLNTLSNRVGGKGFSTRKHVLHHGDTPIGDRDVVTLRGGANEEAEE
jgi:hypothetical protein